LRHPGLRDRPLLVGGNANGTGPILDASPDCLAAGVRPGMAVREALELVPGVVWLPAVPDRDADTFNRVLDALERFSDVIEDDERTGAWFAPAGPLDERRLAAQIVDAIAASLALEARVGIASGKFLAKLLASRATVESVQVVPAESDGAFLAPLPVELLPLPPKAIDRLQLLGVATIGTFAALPGSTLPARFGREASPAHRLARGDDPSPLLARSRPEVLRATRTFEPPIDDRGLILRAASDALGALCRQLGDQRRVGRALRLVVGLEDGRQSDRRADLRHPTNDVSRCQPVLLGMVETLSLDRAAAAVTVMLGPIEPEIPLQARLFEDAGRERAARRERVNDALGEVARRYRGRLRRIVPSDDPANLLDDRRLLLVAEDADGNDGAQPPASTTESAIRIHPVRLMARGERVFVRDPDRPDDGEDEIVALAGKWEADDWWPEATRRTYYRVRSRQGVIATIARDHDRQQWLLVTTFD
jgi:nucleotidyltransferase/DNA polymerase involved in DNA repair